MVVGVALMAVGAILVWAVEYETSWVDLELVGIILGVVGLIAAAASAAVGRRRTVVEERRGL